MLEVHDAHSIRLVADPCNSVGKSVGAVDWVLVAPSSKAS
jgi:hypothetical protein